MIFELLQKMIDSALIQSIQNYLLTIRNALTLSTARAVFVFYGVFFITYFLFFRWFLFSILYGIKGKKKRAKKCVLEAASNISLVFFEKWCYWKNGRNLSKSFKAMRSLQYCVIILYLIWYAFSFAFYSFFACLSAIFGYRISIYYFSFLPINYFWIYI